MSKPFITAMNDISDTLKKVYNAKHAVVIPGSGTYGMEAVARQFATGKKTAVLRNGYFSYRWTQIFEACGIPTDHTVLRAEPINPGAPTNELQYAPHDVDKVVDHILKEKPAVLFAPHVETSTGMILPDAYIKKVSDAVHKVGGLMVLDCIASGTVWIDMQKCGVDALISAPQKGWTGPSCAGLVMLSDRGADVARASRGSSFVCDLRKWLELMDTYEQGGFMYHATMPTDALVTFRDVMMETKDFGFQKATDHAWAVCCSSCHPVPVSCILWFNRLSHAAPPRGSLSPPLSPPRPHLTPPRVPCCSPLRSQLGGIVRKMMCEEKGLVSVSADGFQAPGVVVVHTSDSSVAGKFVQAGTQIAAGVPFMIGEPSDTKTFRIGLFGYAPQRSHLPSSPPAAPLRPVRRAARSRAAAPS